MIGGKINLAKLTHVLMEKQGKTGMVKGLFIPISQNNLFEGKDGNVYLDLIAFELKNPKDGQTHLVKQSLPKEMLDKMSKEEKDAQVILGNLNANIGSGSNSQPANAQPGVVLGESDDLPF